jgi:hypothetical protein
MLLPLLGTVAATAGDTETVGVLAARHYTVRIDPDTIRPRVPKQLLEGFDEQEELADSIGARQPTRFDLWVAEAGHIVRMGYTVEADGLTAPVAVTYDFDDFGTPMDVRPPDGAEVITVDEARERYQPASATPTPAP